MPKVSVIIPVYNVERYLGECLDSILGQTLKDIEVICVDDGSTDESPRILADYAAKDPRVKVFGSPHLGAYRARAVGIRAAAGEYIHFMDSDDILAESAYSDLVARADRDDLDQVIFCGTTFAEATTDRGLKRWRRRFQNRYSSTLPIDGVVMTGERLMRTLMENRDFYVGLPLRLLRTSVIRSCAWGSVDVSCHADMYFTPAYLCLSRRATWVKASYYRRRIREGSITTMADSEAEHLRCLVVVLLELVKIPAFAAAIGKTDDVLNRYLELRVRFLLERSPNLTKDDAVAVCRQAVPGLPAETRMLLTAGVLPLLWRARGNALSVRRCLAYLVRRMLKLFVRNE